MIDYRKQNIRILGTEHRNKNQIGIIVMNWQEHGCSPAFLLTRLRLSSKDKKSLH